MNMDNDFHCIKALITETFLRFTRKNLITLKYNMKLNRNSELCSIICNHLGKEYFYMNNIHTYF